MGNLRPTELATNSSNSLGGGSGIASVFGGNCRAGRPVDSAFWFCCWGLYRRGLSVPVLSGGVSVGGGAWFPPLPALGLELLSDPPGGAGQLFSTHCGSSAAGVCRVV